MIGDGYLPIRRKNAMMITAIGLLIVTFFAGFALGVFVGKLL